MTTKRSTDVMINLHQNWVWITSVLGLGAIGYGLSYFLRFFLPTAISHLEETEIMAASLSEKERFLEDLIGNAGSAITTSDSTGLITRWNRVAESVFGYTKEEALGKQIEFIVPPDRVDEQESLDHRVGKGETVRNHETQCRRKDGTLVDLALTVSPIWDAEGRIVGKLGVSNDITERKRAELELERFRAVMDQAGEALFISDGETRRFVDVNETACRMFGYSREELLQLEPGDIQATSRLQTPEEWKAHVQSIKQSADRLLLHQAPHKRKDGTMFPAEVTLSYRTFGGQDYMVAVLRDITERKRAQEILARQALEARLIHQSTSMAAETDSFEEALQVCVNIVCEMTGWPVGHVYLPAEDGAERLEPTEIWHLAEPDAFATFRDATRRTSFARGIGLPGRIWESGEPDWIVDVQKDPNFPRNKLRDNLGVKGAFGFPIKVGGETVAVLEFFTVEKATPDEQLMLMVRSVGEQVGRVLERKRAGEELKALNKFLEQRVAERTAAVEELNQALEDKNQELEAIIYTMSHDLRSPLVNVQGFSKELALVCETVRSTLTTGNDQDAIKKKLALALEEDIPEALEYILAGVTKMNSLLGGLLRISRLGRAALSIERLNMNALMASVANSMKFHVQEAGATLEIEDLPACLGDAVQINQVFSNFLDNALKYLEPSRPGVIVVSGREEEGRAVYCVKDNGIGIRREHQEKVFGLFHRLDTSAGTGEGLGLTIALRILRRLNGQIWLESEPGEWSAFFVSLPAGPA